MKNYNRNTPGESGILVEEGIGDERKKYFIPAKRLHKDTESFKENKVSIIKLQKRL